MQLRSGIVRLLVACSLILVSAPATAQLQIPYLPPPPLPPPPPYYGGPPPLPPPSRSETPFGLFGGAAAGFRAARLDADIDGADDSYGFMGSVSGNAVATLKFLTGRVGIDMHVGGGDQGVEPRVGGAFTFGVIGHWAQTNGMFIRVGVGGNYEGNDRYFFSHFDLPLAEGGWQLHTDHFAAEVGFRGGATLTGRLGIAPTNNREFGVDGRWGGYALLAAATNDTPLPGGWLDAEFMRLEADSPIHVASLRLCGGFGAFACLDGRLLHADLPRGPADLTPGPHEDVVTLYAGITIGVGAAMAANGIHTLGF